MVYTGYRNPMKALLWTGLALVLTFPLAAQTSPLGTVAQPAATASDPVLKPGDLVRIAVWQQPAWASM